MVGYAEPAVTTLVDLQSIRIAVLALQSQFVPDTAPFIWIKNGRSSTTFVVPEVEAGHSFVTIIVYTPVSQIFFATGGSVS